MPKEANGQATALTQQASGYNVRKRKFNIKEPVRPVAATGLTVQSAENTDSVAKETEDQDSRVPIISYLKDPSRDAERNIRCAAFKYILIDDELYRRTVEDLLLKCLDSDQTKIAMEEVHKGICGTHQSAPKMKWLLRRAGLYWPTMLSDCFRYYKGCEECQQFGFIESRTVVDLVS